MKDQNTAKPGPLFRALAVLGGGLVFVLIASVIHPGSSTADLSPIKQVPTKTTPLGVLMSGQYTVDILGTEGETLYTVRNTEGAILLENATAEQLYQLDPQQLDIRRLTATIGDVDQREF